MCTTMTAHMLAHKLYACVNLLMHPNAHLQKHGRACLHTRMHTDTHMHPLMHPRMHAQNTFRLSPSVLPRISLPLFSSLA